MKRFGPLGYLSFTIWGLVLALIADGWRLGALVALECIFGFVWSPEGLRPLGRFRFWIFIVAAVAVGPFLAIGSDATVEGVVLPWVGASTLFIPGMQMGLMMAGRWLALSLSFSLGLSALSLSDVLAMFDGLHLRGLGFALGLAMNLFSTLQDMAMVTFQTIKLRGGLRRPLVALRLFMVTLLSNTMRYGDQVVSAASVRGFDPNGDRYSPAYPEGILRTADVGLFLALAVCGILLLVLGT